jgi:hypothetical protein
MFKDINECSERCPRPSRTFKKTSKFEKLLRILNEVPEN